jgi:preprotein translocase subunit YajC
MKKVLMVIIPIIVVVILILATWFLFFAPQEKKEIHEESPLEMKDGMPNNATVIAQGTFKGTSYDVSGKALLISVDNKHVLRLEDFESESGPGLYVYLAADLNADNYLDLGKLKAEIGNINYDVPANTDFKTYNKVLIWCEPFDVLFGSADLS